MAITVKVEIDPQGICDAHNICNDVFWAWATECLGTICEESGLVPLESGALSGDWSSVGHAVQWSAFGSNGYNYAMIQHEKPMTHPIQGSDHWENNVDTGKLAKMIAEVIR